MTDPIAEWTTARRRVADLVRELSPDEVGSHVPACPDWTVRDLLSHVVGFGADLVDGNEPDDHDEEWTKAHVEARRDLDVGALLEEWDGIAPAVLAAMHEGGPRPLNDLVIHEQDLRGAAGRSGAQSTDGLRYVRDVMVGRFADAVGDLPVISLRATDTAWQWTSGDGEPAVVLEASEFDLFRALTSRRSAAQLRRWTAVGDAAGHLEAFAGLGPLPDRDLSE